MTFDALTFFGRILLPMDAARQVVVVSKVVTTRKLASIVVTTYSPLVSALSAEIPIWFENNNTSLAIHGHSVMTPDARHFGDVRLVN